MPTDTDTDTDTGTGTSPKPKRLTAAAVAFAAAVAVGAAAGALSGGATPSLAQETTTTAPPDAAASDPAPGEPGAGDPDRRGHHCRRGLRPAVAAAATALGMTREELKDALRAEPGTSIADVAADRGVEVQTVVDALVADASRRLEEAVAAGDLTAEQAAARKAELPERAAALVEHEGGRKGPGRR